MKKKMMRNKIAAVAAAAVLSITFSSADEGMWMVNAISNALEQKMASRGLQLQGNDIYSADGVSLKDAIVSLDFMGTGSMISETGLLITNHHCAYEDVFNLSTPEHNYLEEGFFAASKAEEKPIPGKTVQFLQSVIDVTDEVNMMIDTITAAGKMAGMRRISFLIEGKYSKETGLDASLASMWSGSKYYISLYKVYRDVRLVAAPPVSIAAFGGDTDNWEWPQHKCDFAIYRIYCAPDGSPAPYSEANVPLKPARYLKISAAGYVQGDYTMVLGYPGSTQRYSSSAKVRYLQDTKLPISNQVRGEQMEIMRKWMDADPVVRLKYSDRFFSLSNVQELQCGEVDCYKRFKVVREKQKMERKLRDRDIINTVKTLDDKYEALRKAHSNMEWYRETIIRGTKLYTVAIKLKNIKKTGFSIEKEYEAIDMRVEKDLFINSVVNFYSHVDAECWGPYQRELWNKFSKDGRSDLKALAEYLWTDEYMKPDDPIARFYQDLSIADFNRMVSNIDGEPTLSDCNRKYTRGLYNRRNALGIAQYPDANSTMRLTYGTVSTFRRDGKKMPWQTFSKEILAKEDRNSYDFTLKDRWRKMISDAPQAVPVDFITDNDITGGNSGSPVLNARGEVIGLAFDGNKESLASDCSWTAEYNKCVCVDIRFVLWTLKNWFGADYILDELEIIK